MKHLKLFEQFLNEGFINESKKFPDAFAVLDFFGGALPNDYSKAHAAAKKAGYDLPTSLYDQAAHMAQDGENEDLYEGRIALNHEFLNEGFKNKKDFEKFLEEIDGMPESQIKKIMGKDYIDTPGFYQDEKEDYDGIVDFMKSNMGKSDFEKLKTYWEKNVSESLNEGRIALNHVYANAPVRNKVLEILKNGRVTEEDFMAAVSKAGAPTKWISRNSHFFKVEEEDGVKYYSLTKSGHVIMSAINESEVLEIYEEFGLEENLIVDPLDLTQDFFYVSINGKTYGYQAKPGGNIEDVAKTFRGMLKYSAGKALAWLKKNSELVYGGKAVNEAADSLTVKDKEWVKSLGNDKIEYNDQRGSGDHTLSAILSLMAGQGLRWGGAENFGFDHVDMYEEKTGKTILPGATAGKYTFNQLLAKVKTLNESEIRESEETFIQTVKKEMDWNKPSVSIVHKDSDFAKYLKMLGVQDGWKEAYQYKGLPGSSVASKLKSLAAKYAHGQKVEVKRGTEKSAQSQFHDYFIIFR